MKTILVPTDFSEVSENAAYYAFELAKYTKAKVILLNVFSIPLPVAEFEVPAVLLPIDEIEKGKMKELEAFDKKRRLLEKYSDVEVEYLTRAGFVSEEIELFMEERNVNMVVMGVTGAGKAPGILGSNATTVMKKAQCPVMIVPKEIKFKKPEIIALACDYNSTVAEGVVNKLKEFVKLFGAKLLVFNVLKKAELVSFQKSVAEVNLENSLGEMEHALFFPSGDNLEHEINMFIENHKADILTLIPHDYKFLQGLFHHSETRKMAFLTHVPLLSIHE